MSFEVWSTEKIFIFHHWIHIHDEPYQLRPIQPDPAHPSYDALDSLNLKNLKKVQYRNFHLTRKIIVSNFWIEYLDFFLNYGVSHEDGFLSYITTCNLEVRNHLVFSQLDCFAWKNLVSATRITMGSNSNAYMIHSKITYISVFNTVSCSGRPNKLTSKDK